MMKHGIDLALGAPWLITETALETILAVAQRHFDGDAVDIQALEARLGRRLDNTRNVTTRNGVAVVPITGPIFRHANLMTNLSGATSTQVLATDIMAAADDEAVKAILLTVNSPGGQATGIQDLAQLIREVSARKTVKVFAEEACSAAYWLAAATSEIICSPSSVLGSIGAVLGMRDTSEADAKAGVRQIKIISSQSPLKQADPTTDEGRAAYQGLADKLAAEFIADVAAARGVSIDKVLSDFGRGGVMLGRDAVAAGMADRLGTFESLLAELSAGSRPPTKKKAAAAVMENKAMIELKTGEALSAAMVAEHAPDIAAHFRAEGAKTATAAERSRILAIQAAALPGHDDLVAKCIADGAEAGSAALMIVAAEKQKGPRQLQTLSAEAAAQPKIEAAADPKPVEPAAPQLDASAPLEDRAKAAWAADAGLRAEFKNNFQRFHALAKAEGLDKAMAR